MDQLIDIFNDDGVLTNTVLGSEEWANKFVPGRWQFHKETNNQTTKPLPLVDRPRIVVTGVRSTAQLRSLVIEPQGLSEVTVQVGSVVMISAALMLGGKVVAKDDEFRLPVVSRDGRERMILATMAAGVISITVRLDASGVWQVTQEQINADLPPDEQMDFGGFRIFAFE